MLHKLFRMTNFNAREKVAEANATKSIHFNLMTRFRTALR